MERIINIHIGKLPEGVYLATSENIQGLVAQGLTITETLDTARDVVEKLIEAQQGEKEKFVLIPTENQFDYPLIVGI